jgi:hypothetical protein
MHNNNEHQQKFLHCGYRHVRHRQDDLRQRPPYLIQKFSQTNAHTFCINLDPAVKVVPYKPFLDIRDTYEYKKVRLTLLR